MSNDIVALFSVPVSSAVMSWHRDGIRIRQPARKDLVLSKGASFSEVAFAAFAQAMMMFRVVADGNPHTVAEMNACQLHMGPKHRRGTVIGPKPRTEFGAQNTVTV